VIARLRGVVEAIKAERPGIQEIIVKTGEERRNALNYPELTGAVSPGDLVHLNTWAVSMDLGTGGWDFVCAVERESLDDPPPGHILKLRYTPLQFPVLAVAAQESPDHSSIRDFVSLDGIPVVCAELHSQIPAIAAAVKWETKGAARIVYVMSDGGALPLAFSRLIPKLRELGLIDATITAGNSFGGDYEAVNLYSGIAAAHAVASADVIIVCQGPGSTGTSTALGFSGVDQGIALNAAVSLGGTPIAVARMSFADPRVRHRGISHHTLTVLQSVVLTSVYVPVPRMPMAQALLWKSKIDKDLFARHEFVTVDAEAGFDALDKQRLPLSTMGRDMDEEEPFFLSAVAAGLFAGQWTTGTFAFTPDSGDCEE
jgi:hypothetical protein